MFRPILVSSLVFTLSPLVFGQQAPSIGYVFPPAITKGEPVNVVLGGYDWTPDMQLFARHAAAKLEIAGPPSKVIVPEPPYWFGKKARRRPFLLPRETPAELRTVKQCEPGIIQWQAANANGATGIGRFIISGGPLVTEDEDRAHPQRLPELPIEVAARIKHIQEVDRYEFTVPRDQLVTATVTARAIGSELNAAVDIRDSSGRLVASTADTAGNDTAVTFAAKANDTYTASVFDVDFRGNRAFVYHLALATGPRVVAMIPSSGDRGETRPVEFVGYGVGTGAAMLESVTQDVAFPADTAVTSFAFRLETPFGDSPSVTFGIDDLPVVCEASERASTGALQKIEIPTSLFGVIDERFGTDRLQFTASQGSSLSIDVTAKRMDLPLDLAVAISDSTGKQLARNDDLPGTTDAGLEFKVPEDGQYVIAVSDASANSGNRAAVYRLCVRQATPDFSLTAPEFINTPLGGDAKLVIQARRGGGFREAIALSVNGLPEGVTVPPDLAIAANKSSVNIPLSAADRTAATASLATIRGEATLAEHTIVRETEPILVATTITPPFAIDAEGKDDVTKWPRGSTFPAPVLIQRNDGFDGEIMLEMTSRQGRHRQGIRGPELAVPPGVNRILYPVFLPEWLETTRTSRMVVNGVARVSDPKGNIRYSVSRQKTRMGFLPGGALLKLSATSPEWNAKAGESIRVPLTVSRSAKVDEDVRIELMTADERLPFAAESKSCVSGQSDVEFEISVAADAVDGEYWLPIRATALLDGHLPAISETHVLVTIDPPTD